MFEDDDDDIFNDPLFQNEVISASQSKPSSKPITDLDLSKNVPKPISPTSTKKPAKVMPRKFPGPAGLLPHRSNLQIHSEQSEDDDNVICTSQSSVDTFESGVWRKMMEDYRKPTSTGYSLPDKYNVAWIVATAQSNRLIKRRAPFLAVAIKSIECHKLNTAVVKVFLRDETGCIEGMIVHDLYEEHASELVEGSVLVLRQFGVLSTAGLTRHYITITNNNLVAIYCHSKTTNGDIKTVSLQELTLEDIVKNIANVKSRFKIELLEQDLIEDFNNDDVKRTPPIQVNVPKFSRAAYQNSPVPNSRTLPYSSPLKSSGGESKNFNFKSVKNSYNKPMFDVKPNSTATTVGQLPNNKAVVEKSHILNSIFEGMDTDALFDDF